MFSYQHSYELWPLYINEKYKGEEQLFYDDPEILWEIVESKENGIPISLILTVIRRSIAIFDNETIVELSLKAYGHLDLTNIENDKPVFIDWIKNLSGVLNMYWEVSVSLPYAKKQKPRDFDKVADMLFEDLKKWGHYN